MKKGDALKGRREDEGIEEWQGAGEREEGDCHVGCSVCICIIKHACFHAGGLLQRNCRSYKLSILS